MLTNRLTSWTRYLVAGLILLAAVCTVAACSGSGNAPSSGSTTCNIDVSAPTVSENVYINIVSSNGALSQTDCQTIVSTAASSGYNYGVTASVVPALPSGLVSACNGSGPGYTYNVLSDGSSTGVILAGDTCSGITGSLGSSN